jgi:uncharacterized protein with GYD domain
MRTYLWSVSYTASGAEGLLKEGGTARRKTLDELVATLGGSIKAWYYAFGSDDLCVIADLPDDADAAAVSLQVAASGAARIHTTVLLTPEQIDEAAKATISYRSPGA